MQLPPKLNQLLQNSRDYLETPKGRRIALVAGGVFLLILIVLFSSSEQAAPRIALPEPLIVEKPLPPAPPNSDNSAIILELFSPTAENISDQQTKTTYRQQIEQTLTVTFLLTKCLVISQDDYTAIFRALIVYAERTGLGTDAISAEAQVREIAESAKASYALVYSRVSCGDPQLDPLAKDIVLWADKMFKLD